MSKRVRIFAGPNGSGKSTITRIVKDKVKLGTYVNADDIKEILCNERRLDFATFNILIDSEHFVKSLKKSTWSERIKNTNHTLSSIHIDRNVLLLDESYEVEDYFVTFTATYIWEELLKSSDKFTVETVMSHESKLQFIKRAKANGFKVYLYFVSLVDPALNKHRVKTRVAQGGHDVDEDKIEKRYYRTMNNLLPALRQVDNAYLFDNSSSEAKLFATKENGELKVEGTYVPQWYKTYVLDKL